MIQIQVTDYIMLVAFWLSFSRWLAVIMQLPIMEHNAIPAPVKILSTLVITYAFFPATSGEVVKDIQYMGVDKFWLLTAYNVIVGLILGYFVKSIMDIYISAGSLITQNVGFAAVRYYDPSAGQQVGPFEMLIQWTMLIMIISSGALLPMFKGVFNSFLSIHIYDLGKFAHSPEYFFDMFKSIFFSALLLASPLIFTNMMLNVVMGIMSKTVPQMNVIMVSFVLNIGIGLLVFAATSEEFFQVAYRMYTESLGKWFQFVS